MFASSSTIKTQHASKYLVQLCKHFAHKVRAECDGTIGHVDFPPGPCVITAWDEGISFHCESQDAKGVAVMQGIIEQHLVKFAWREDISFAWEDCSGKNCPTAPDERNPQ